MTAQEPIMVEVLRRPATSLPASNRNSVYIPPKSPSNVSLKMETSVQTEMVMEDDEDFLMPGLDYEVRRPNPLIV